MPRLFEQSENTSPNLAQRLGFGRAGNITENMTLTNFIAWIRSNVTSSESTAGVNEIATQTETNTGTADNRVITPLKLANRTSTETRAGVIELATQAEVDAGTDTTRAVTPSTLANSTYVGNLKEIIDIGDWNMDTSTTPASGTVAHTVGDAEKIRAVSVMIRNDAGTNVYKLDFANASTGVVQGTIGIISDAAVVLNRLTGGTFDSASFSATSYNRGWVTIEYVP